MSLTQDIINEIKGLRGSKVTVFGQPTTLPSEIDDYTIDICDLLEKLIPFELDEELTKVEEEDVDYNTSKLDIVLNRLVEHGYIEDEDGYKADNSYNWNAPVSNDFNIMQWLTDDGMIVAIKVHRYGDVRGNYTDYAWYKFIDEYNFDDVVYETTKCNCVEYKGKEYDCYVSLYSNYITVVQLDDGYESFDIYEYIDNDEDMVKAIAEYLNS